MHVRPISPEKLVAELVDLLMSRDSDSHPLRVAIDGPPAAAPGRLADELIGPLRVLGHPAIRVDTADFLRPASLRFEFGRRDPDSYYSGWFDEAGLAREVLGPAGPGGSGNIVTSLWDAGRDRASRAPYRKIPPEAVVLIAGPLLLGAGLDFDVSVHLQMSAAALRRRTDQDDQWILPAFERYAGEVGPAAFADLVVRLDDPRHPAVVEDRW